MTKTTMTTGTNARPARRLIPMLALLVAFGTGACGGDAVGDDQSIVVIHVNIEAGVPELHQIHVAAHLGSAGLDSDLFFPTMPQGPIASGATLALLIPKTRSGLLDLILFGLNAGQDPVAQGNGQTIIVVGGRVDPTITLRPCSSSGPGSGC
jgi:hypothetical protein